MAGGHPLDEPGWWSVRQTAEYLRVGESAVWHAIDGGKGKLPATKLGRDWWIRKTDAERYKNSYARPRR